jgi:hypothetical protein
MRPAAVVLVLAAAFASARPARAFEEFQGTRALGMGGATRAWAIGDSSPLLNPSGMTLVKAYSVEASYAYTSRNAGQFFHGSIVDSTSAAGIAGAVYYTFRMDSPAGLPKGRGHEVGASLAMPLGPYVGLGATLKWFRLQGADRGPAPELSPGGLTVDAGLTLRPSPRLSFAAVGSNLRDLNAGQAPQMVSFGAAFLPVPELVLALDAFHAFTRDDFLGTRGTGFAAGGEWVSPQRVAVRAGGGTDPLLGVGYLSGGLSILSDIGALDLGVRGDVFPMETGSARNVFVGASLRLLVVGASASAQP